MGVSIRSERRLMEQTQDNLLFCWFLGRSMDDTVWVPMVLTNNRERLIEHDAVVGTVRLVMLRRPCEPVTLSAIRHQGGGSGCLGTWQCVAIQARIAARTAGGRILCFSAPSPGNQALQAL
jgi:hypothetical protein